MKPIENKKNRMETLKAAYESLPAFEQTLLQLCSVIFEPTDLNTIWKSYHKTGFTFPENKITNKKDLKRYLTQFQHLNLLGADYTCNDMILEEISRHAVSAKGVVQLNNHIKLLDSETSWITPSPDIVACASCNNDISFLGTKTPTGWLCASCALLKLKSFAEKENLTNWPVVMIKESLLPDSGIGRRLVVLFHFTDAIQIIKQQAPLEVNEFMRLLVRNLGYLGPHPFAQPVRQAALIACKSLGLPILPLLLEMFDTEPWQYYANIVMAAGSIAPEDKQVRRLLEKAAKESNPKIQYRVRSAISTQTSIWAKTLAEKIELNLKSEEQYTSEWEPILNDLYEKSNNSFSADNYGVIAKAVQEESPLPDHFQNHHSAVICKRLMRDFRIGLYTQNEALLENSYQHLCTFCYASDVIQDPFIQVCANPFDSEWFDTLPMKIRLYTLSEIFLNTLSCFEPDEDALEYSLSKPFQDSIPQAYKTDFYKILISRLLMGGRLNKARQLIAKTETNRFTDGLSGWLFFIEGKNDLALNSFEADLKLLRKNANSYNRFFPGISGLFHILALLKHQLIHRDPFSLDKAERLVTIALSRQHRIPFIASAYTSLLAIIEAQQDRIKKAHNTLYNNLTHGSCIAEFFQVLAESWVNNRVDNKKISAFVDIYLESKNIGLNWFAMEAAELLCHIEQPTPVRRNYVKQIQEKTGMTPVSEYIPADETWQRNLRALARVTASPPTLVHDVNTRLVWLVGYQNNYLTIEPREQKLTARESWTKGRPVTLSRLFLGKNLDFLTSHDRKICSAIEKATMGDGSIDYQFNLQKLLPAIIGHPLLFLSDSPDISVKVKKGEPEVIVDQTETGFRLKLQPNIPPRPVSVQKDGPTQFKIIQLSEKQQRIASILGKNGLEVPSAAKEEVLSIVTGMSSIVTVHSVLGDKITETEEIVADPTPYVHLIPSGNGFTLSLLVKPFTIGDPYLKPGKGAENIITEIKGKRFQTKRNLEMEEQKATMVETHCPSLNLFSEGYRKWCFSDPEDCLNVLMELKELQINKQVMVEWPEGEKIKLIQKVSLDHLYLKIHKKTDWFEMSGQLKTDDNLIVDMKSLLALANQSNSRFIPLKDGQFIALTQALRRQLEEINTISQSRGKTIQLPPIAPIVLFDLAESVPNLEADKKWTSQIEQIQDLQNFNPKVPSTLKAKLRSYQIEGYKWMAGLSLLGSGACLADDMGLGKTLQALTIILDRSKNGPSLVVAPTSVCMNWISEIDRFAPTLTPILFGGKKRKHLIKSLKQFDVLIISYALMQLEADLLSQVTWETIVMDEAQAIKNHATKRSKAALGLDGKFKMITTGTPIENHLGELYTLFKFINPGLLGSRRKFNDKFALPIENDNDRHAMGKLKKLIQPFILRRIKSQVLEELPPRTDIVLQVEMEQKEASFYEALRQKAVERLQDNNNVPEGQRHLKILAEIMKLRRACCNPRLIVENSSLPSSKLGLFENIISELLENQHKALIFSQFVDHLAIIRELLESKNINYCYLDGSTPQKERKKRVDDFQAGSHDLFLISLKAGGVGLNLTAADYVIHMDPWWNPAVEDQASDRAHRIGQKHPVTVYRLVMKDTIEEKIVKLHSKKRDLASSLLSGSDISGKMSTDELFKLVQDK